VTVGAFAAILISLRQFYGFMYELIEERFAWAFQNIASIKNYLDFVNGYHLPKKTCNFDKNMDIILRNVYFSYPSSTNHALSNINLTIPYGQTVALVGENGSGKSTLCALIEGLYSPDRGSIIFGNNEVNEKKCTGVSAVFQRFMKYSLRIKDNIIISDIDNNSDNLVIADICDKLDVCLDKNGIDAQLGKEFGGKELSDGQWQRLAIARGIYKKCNLIIMDEPTSAIDPIEESKLFEKIYELSQNQTSIIVTHRMALTKLANRILVMKNGKIVQDGTHEQLYNKDGEYRRLYQMQMQWYVNQNQ
jgi:ATP-binding cassette subfamily B protein